PTYREAFRRRRCLMPAAEFFELGHGFHLAEHRTFAFAALWDRWRDADGAVVETCTMLTTEPNEVVAAVGHNRMPVIFIGEDEYDRWLDPEIVERPPLEDLMRPTPGGIWHVHRPVAESNAEDPAVHIWNARSDGRDSAESQGQLFD
ncbi:MAG: SOS response-associated peptidase family protein, partial [Pirellulales bacterium]|nr:SOS response-associated peptidase family protein [Pirellulales bacterium]